MERSHAGPSRSRRNGSVGSGTVAGFGPSEERKNKRRVSYGLGLLLLALSVGLAAALFLTIGTANADVFLVGMIAAF